MSHLYDRYYTGHILCMHQAYRSYMQPVHNCHSVDQLLMNLCSCTDQLARHICLNHQQLFPLDHNCKLNSTNPTCRYQRVHLTEIRVRVKLQAHMFSNKLGMSSHTLSTQVNDDKLKCMILSLKKREPLLILTKLRSSCTQKVRLFNTCQVLLLSNLSSADKDLKSTSKCY